MYNMHLNIPPLRLAFICITAVTVSIKTGPYCNMDGFGCHIIQDDWIAQTIKLWLHVK